MAPRKKLGEILVQAGVLNESQLRAALTEQRRWGGPLGRILVDMKLISEDAMVQALSHQLNLPAVNLDGRDIEPQTIDLIPGELAEQHAAVPFAVQGKFVDVAMVDPTNLVAIDALRIKTRMNVRPYLAGPKAIERAISRHYGRGVAPLEIGGFSTRSTVDLPGEGSFDGGPAPTTQIGLGTATARRAAQFGLGDATPRPPAAPQPPPRDPEVDKTIAMLRERIERLEALVERDEDVLRKLLTFLVQKGVATREEILERIK